jgi:uridine phosphorylase
MSIIDTFDAVSEEIIKSADLGVSGSAFPQVVLSTFQDEIIQFAAKRYQAKPIGVLKGYIPIDVYEFEYHGKSIGLYRSIPGAPLTASLMERYIGHGGKKFIFWGSCGVLDRKIPEGHFLVPTEAYRDEGVSYHYAPAADYIDIPTAGKTAEIFEAKEIPFVRGKTWTTDAILRETRKNMEARKQEGCLSVEMECASVMAVGAFRGVDVYQFLYAADNLDAKKWDRRSLGDRTEALYDRSVSAALAVALAI